ncbi:hypothetical protein J7384_17105 [Endozoicomonas sp. G2_1]|uniref:portal protein n=1 Tax=Endozoicomonas sp. G2_1 TaxID=2821091 RepID=UPI001ADA86B3|nr:hypothetical protein [Endozoicomonas sp. G2_1]MBO9492083.1 hypothetical protein [Endozoicomonas sp. G2_1]
MTGILQSLGAEQTQAIFDQQKHDEREKANPNYGQQEVVSGLASYVKSCWDIAKHHKLTMTDRLTNCLRRRKGMYSSNQLANIRKAGGSEIFMGITGTKCRHAKSWISDIYNPSGDRPFSLEPTPVQELPPQLKEHLLNEAMQGALQHGVPEQEAYALMKKHETRLKEELNQEGEKRMELMGDYIEDILVEGNYRREFDEFLDDLTTYPSAIMKGVIFKQKKQLKWKQINNGEFVPQTSLAISREFSRVSPFDFYPSPNTIDIGDSWTCEHIRYTAPDLSNMRGMKGYNRQAIESVLRDYRMNGHREWLFESNEREQLEGRDSSQAYRYELFDAVEFNGHVQGQQLIDWGMNPSLVDDPYNEYPVSVTLIGNHIIRALINPDPTGRPPYYKASWLNVPNSFWGEAIPEVIADIQDAANSTARALMNNMAIGSAPQTAIDVSMLPTGSKPTAIHPRKVWLYDGSKGSHRGGSAGVTFFSPDIKANELLGVYERFERYADDKSGIPSYMQGSDQGAGAARTASGLSMLMNAASKSIKDVVRNIDIGVIEPVINSIFITLMLDKDIPADIKGDAKAKARGSDALMHKEAAALRQQELLQLTNNPVDLEIIGTEGRLEQLRRVFQTSDVPVNRILPNKEQLRERQQEQMKQQQQQMQQEMQMQEKQLQDERAFQMQLEQQKHSQRQPAN